MMYGFGVALSELRGVGVEMLVKALPDWSEKDARFDGVTDTGG
jgi:hypothetical protein